MSQESELRVQALPSPNLPSQQVPSLPPKGLPLLGGDWLPGASEASWCALWESHSTSLSLHRLFCEMGPI